MTWETEIQIVSELPVIKITRTFEADQAQLYRAHVDPELFVRWIGPEDMTSVVDYWDARTGGSWRYTSTRGNLIAAFRGCFHELRGDELVISTQTYEGTPDRVSLDRLVIEGLGARRSRLVCTSLHESFESRDALISSGMQRGLTEAYGKLDRLFHSG